MAAIRKPAPTAMHTLANQEWSRICRLTASMPSRSSGAITGVKVQNREANSVPAMLARNTIVHMRARPRRFFPLKSAITGSTTVTVFSVNSCWRDSTTMTKPIE